MVIHNELFLLYLSLQYCVYTFNLDIKQNHSLYSVHVDLYNFLLEIQSIYAVKAVRIHGDDKMQTDHEIVELLNLLLKKVSTLVGTRLIFPKSYKMTF